MLIKSVIYGVPLKEFFLKAATVQISMGHPVFLISHHSQRLRPSYKFLEIKFCDCVNIECISSWNASRLLKYR